MKRMEVWALFAVCLVALLAVPGVATGDSDNAATVVRGTGVIWFDGNGNPVAVPDANFQIVYTNNDDGTTNIRVHGTLPDGAVLPKKAQHYDTENTGFGCGAGVPEFSGVTTPSGRFSFTCHG